MKTDPRVVTCCDGKLPRESLTEFILRTRGFYKVWIDYNDFTCFPPRVYGTFPLLISPSTALRFDSNRPVPGERIRAAHEGKTVEIDIEAPKVSYDAAAPKTPCTRSWAGKCSL